MSLKIELMLSAVLGAALLTAPVFAGTMKTHHDCHLGGTPPEHIATDISSPVAGFTSLITGEMQTGTRV
jgi:hypothetical protein